MRWWNTLHIPLHSFLIFLLYKILYSTDLLQIHHKLIWNDWQHKGSSIPPSKVSRHRSISPLISFPPWFWNLDQHRSQIVAFSVYVLNITSFLLIAIWATHLQLTSTIAPYSHSQTVILYHNLLYFEFWLLYLMVHNYLYLHFNSVFGT